jgi:hypothetical protein
MAVSEPNLATLQAFRTGIASKTGYFSPVADTTAAFSFSQESFGYNSQSETLVYDCLITFIDDLLNRKM